MDNVDCLCDICCTFYNFTFWTRKLVYFGYNIASNEEKEKYDEKKLCRTMGIGMSIIAILALIMGLFENILPAFFVYIALGIILVDVVVIIILGNTLCRK